MYKLRNQIFVALGFAGLTTASVPACGSGTDGNGESDSGSGTSDDTTGVEGNGTSGTTDSANSGTTDASTGGTADATNAGTTDAGTGGTATTGDDSTTQDPSVGGSVSTGTVANSGVPCMPDQQQCYLHGDVRSGQGLGEAGAPAGWTCPQSLPSAACGSILLSSSDTECCYSVALCCLAGRPYVVEGEVRTASSMQRHDWAVCMPGRPQPQPRAQCQALAAAWLEDALFEHASVAAFARLSLELMALGAPAELVQGASLAAADEVEHARLCFGLAARYSQETWGPGPLALQSDLKTPSLSQLAVATAVEGCVHETIAAAVAAEQHRVAKDPVVRAALETIQRDEARHAELAYKIVSWAIARGGAPVTRAVRAAFADATQSLLAGPIQNTSGADELNQHGRLAPAQRARIAELTVREVIRPCAALLLRPPERARAAGDRASV